MNPCRYSDPPRITLTGNSTSEAVDSLVTGDTINNFNQLKTRQGGIGVMPIRGTTNEPSTVTVNGTPATVKADNSFEGKAAVTAGDNTVTVTATDANGNATTNRYCDCQQRSFMMPMGILPVMARARLNGIH